MATTAIRRQVIIKKCEDTAEITLGCQEQTVHFRSKAVVVSNGGSASLPVAFYKDWFPSMVDKKHKVLLADRFLKRQTYKETMLKINQNKW